MFLPVQTKKPPQSFQPEAAFRQVLKSGHHRLNFPNICQSTSLKLLSRISSVNFQSAPQKESMYMSMWQSPYRNLNILIEQGKDIKWVNKLSDCDCKDHCWLPDSYQLPTCHLLLKLEAFDFILFHVHFLIMCETTANHVIGFECAIGLIFMVLEMQWTTKSFCLGTLVRVNIWSKGCAGLL